MLADYMNVKLQQYKQARAMADSVLREINSMNQSGGALVIGDNEFAKLDEPTKNNVVSIQNSLQELENLNFAKIVAGLNACDKLATGDNRQLVEEIGVLKDMVSRIKGELEKQKNRITAEYRNMSAKLKPQSGPADDDDE